MRQVAKYMIEGDFHRFTGPIAEGFSGRQFALVVEPLDSRAGEASFGGRNQFVARRWWLRLVRT